MVSRPTRIVLAVALGTLLLVNPAFGLPGEKTQTYTYTAEPVENPLSAMETVNFDRGVQPCWAASRSCLFEKRAADEPIRVDAAAGTSSVSSQYRFLHFDGQFYRPTTHIENGTYVLGLEPVSKRTVLAGIAYHDEDRLTDIARRAVANRSVNVTVPADQRLPLTESRLVERGGNYYVISFALTSEHNPLTSTWWFGLLRAGGVLLGLLSLCYGYYLAEK